MSAPAAGSSDSSAVLSSWFDAARSGDVTDLTSVWSSGRVPSIDARDAQDHTVLMVACEGAAEECVRELLAKRAQVGLTDAGGRTALHMACDAGAIGCVRRLLEAGAQDDQELDANATDAAGDSPLILACRALDPTIVRLLLEYPDQRVDTEIYNDAGETALLVVAAQCTQESVRDAIEVMTLLTSHPTNPAKINRPHKLTSQSALLLIIAQGSLDGVRWILKVKGVELDAQDAEGMTALMHCVSDELPIGLMKLLLDAKASQLVQNKKGYTALHLAIRDDNSAMVDLLIAQAPPALAFVLDFEFAWTPLQHAISQNKVEYVKAWGERSLSVDGKDKRGSTAAHLAARFGFLTCLKYCVKFGAKLDERDAIGSTALMDACGAGQIDCVRWLREKGAPVDGKKGVDNRGNNVIHRLVEKEALHPHALEVAKILLDTPTANDTLLHAKNADGDTPWMVARRRGPSHAALAAYFADVTKRSLPVAPVLKECLASDSGTIQVAFDIPENYKLLLLEHRYEVTATPVRPAAERKDGDAIGDGGDGEVVALAKKKKVGGGGGGVKDGAGEEKKAASSKKAATGTTAAAASSSTKAKSGASSTKVASSASSTSSVKKASASAAASSSTKEPRSIVTALATPQTVIGTSSPLRVSNLVNGTRYILTLVTVNSIGRSAASAPSAPVMVGTPPPPSITSVTTGATWASVTFVPGGGATGTQSTGQGDQAAIIEFILTATVVTSNPRHSAPVLPSSSSSSSSSGSGGVLFSSPMHRILSCVSSPVLLTGLGPGLSYAISMRARNGYGEGAPTTARVVKAEEAPPATPSSPSAHLHLLTPAMDAGDLAEASSLLYSALGSDLNALIRAQRKASGDDAAGLRITRTQRIENGALRHAFDRAPLFMQALGCPRAESLRESVGSICVATEAQAAMIARYGVLPLAHPHAHAFQANSTETSVYNANTYPLGSPFRACYLHTLVHKRTLIQAAAASAGGLAEGAAAADQVGPGAHHRVLLCRFLPGRCRSDIPAAAAGASASFGGFSGDSSSSPSLSAAFDSHRSSSGDQVMVYSTYQILPLYLVDFTLELMVPTQAVVSEMDAVLAADADQQVHDSSESLADNPPAGEREASALTRGFGVSKWMGSAPAGSAAAPGELPAGASASSVAASSSASVHQQQLDDDDLQQERDLMDEQPRLNINQAVSSVLGPAVTVATSKPKPSKSASSNKK